MENETESQPPVKKLKVQKKLTSFFSTEALRPLRHSKDEQSTESIEPVLLTYPASASQPKLDVLPNDPNDRDDESGGTRKNFEPKQNDTTATISADQSCKNTLHGAKSSGTYKYPTCWSADQYNYFMTTYPWIFCENGNIGCNICGRVKSLGLATFTTKSRHLSNEWSACSVRRGGEKAAAQKALRKKIQKHARSQEYVAANNILAGKKRKKIGDGITQVCAHSRELTERCLRTAYFVGYQNRPFTDYPELLTLQNTNRIELGSSLHSRYTCTEMIDCIADTMRRKICNTIKDNDRKIS